MSAQLCIMLMFVPLIADTGLTTLRRMWAGHHPFTPHCDFYYQRMPRAYGTVLHYWLATILWGMLGLLLS